MRLDTQKPPNQTEEKSAENTKKSDDQIDGITAPVAIPPSFGQTSTTTGEDGLKDTDRAFPGLSPMKGVNVDALFSERIKDSDKRFDRVETAVLDMRKEFETIKPSIIRLLAVESDIKNLTKELDVLLQETPNPEQPAAFSTVNQPDPKLQVAQLETQPPPVPQVAEQKELGEPTEPQQSMVQPPALPTQKPPEPAKDSPPKTPDAIKSEKETKSAAPHIPPPKPATSTAPASGKIDSGTAGNLRIGDHDGKTRIVIDTGSKPSYSVDYDDTENLVLVEIEDMVWSGATEKTINGPLITSYTVTPANDEKGTMIAITLKKKARLLKQSLLDPDDNPNYRIYFDLAP